MKIGEMIDALQCHLEKHGDIEVWVTPLPGDDLTEHEVDSTEVWEYPGKPPFVAILPK